MTAGLRLAAMLATRRALESANPDALEWSRAQWTAWLASRQKGEIDHRRELVVAAALTCLEDVWLHLALARLLEMKAARCSLLLSLSTEEAVRLARSEARREGWEMLVHILTDDECDRTLRRMPADTLLVFLRCPSLLPTDRVERITNMLNCLHAVQSSALGNWTGFIGYAGEYGAWRDPAETQTESSITQAIEDMMSFRWQAASSPRAASIEEPMSASTTSLRISGNAVEVPDLAPGEELLIASTDKGEPVAIARETATLTGLRPLLSIRVPATLLTTEPRGVRLSCGGGARKRTSMDLQVHVPPSKLKPWMVSAFLNRGGAGNAVIRAFADGVGCRIAYAEDEPELLRDIPIVWGVLRDSDRILAQAKAQQLYFFYIDHAYFQRGHGKSYRITRNAYEAGPVRECPSDRADELQVPILPWRKSGRNIIVCPPTEHFMEAHGCPDWLATTLEELRTVTDRPIIVREKPKAGEQVQSLPEALATAHALVTHSSNVAIEAACLGTPVFVSGTSAAAPVGATDLGRIETPAYPDRRPWLSHLAYNQYSFDEIGDGRAWRMLLENEDRRLV